MTAWSQNFEALLRQYLTALESDEPLPGTRPMAELGLDSLATVNLMVDLERSFDVEFPDEALVPETFSTAEALWKMLSGLAPRRDGA